MKKWMALVMIAVCVVGCNSKEGKKRGQDSALAQKASAKLMQQGVQFLNNRDIPKAVISFQGAIQVNPKDLQPYMVLAEVFIRLKSYPDAINVLERAANVFPDNGFVFYMLSIANQEAGNPLPAVLAARRSAELFKAQNNEEGFERSMTMMQALVKSQQDLQMQNEAQPTTKSSVSTAPVASMNQGSVPAGKQ